MSLAQQNGPSSRASSGQSVPRPLLLSGARLLVLGIASLPLLRATPIRHTPFTILADDDEPPVPPDSPTLWIYLAVATCLVLLGGAFAGLTIALMGQVISMRFRRDSQLTRKRMKYICKSSRPLAKAPRKTMQRRSSDCSSAANIGCWSHCCLEMLSPTRPCPLCWTVHSVVDGPPSWVVPF